MSTTTTTNHPRNQGRNPRLTLRITDTRFGEAQSSTGPEVCVVVPGSAGLLDETSRDYLIPLAYLAYCR
eukprot:7172106-Prymnesium_polylepis.1